MAEVVTVKVKVLQSTLVSPDGLHHQAIEPGQVISLPLQLAKAMVRDKLVEMYKEEPTKSDSPKKEDDPKK